ncbi:MAG: IclR family transcriptional regulator [Deltaproteobacteria bacterium]|nr:IclR family transcriptional regulator [Deltaproteobacteria bacterium]
MERQAMGNNLSLRNGLMILECFTPQKSNLTLSEISRLNGLSKASVSRILKTLSELEYLKYRPQDRRYFLGPKVLSLGFSVIQAMEVRDIARPYLEELSQECHQTVNLGVIDGNEMVYIDRIRFPDLRELNIRIGSRIPIYNSALGRAVLAYKNREQLAAILEKIGNDSHASEYMANNKDKLIAALERARKERFASSDEEFAEGIRAIAVPIFSHNGSVEYSINIVAPSQALTMEQLHITYAAKLVRVGNEISRMLGYSDSRENKFLSE